MSRRSLESIGLALAGRAGARLARCLGMSASRDTLLRLVTALPEPPVESWRCLDAMRRHVEAFAEMIRELSGGALDEWMGAVLADDLPQLHSFVTGLRRDQQAVAAGLTLPYSSGPVEGAVNRIKMIKRQMFGRAGFSLLRKRILLAR